MFKIIKWILLILIGLQLIHWYMLKTDTPISIVSVLEKSGCIGYQSNGMDLPISYLINTETIGTVYLQNTNYPMFPQRVDLKVRLIDMDYPLLKSSKTFKYEISGDELFKNFFHCYDGN